MSEEALLSTFRQFRDALFACDTEALDSLLAEDYRGYNLRGGLEDRVAVLEAYSPGNAELRDFEVAELRVDVFSEVGIVTGRGYVEGQWQGQTWSHHLRFCDIYVLREGRWILFLSHGTPLEDPARGT